MRKNNKGAALYFSELLKFFIFPSVFCIGLLTSDKIEYISLGVLIIVLFPFARRMMILIGLRFFQEKFWLQFDKGMTVGSSGVVALYYILITVFSIPLSVVYFAYALYKKDY